MRMKIEEEKPVNIVTRLKRRLANSIVKVIRYLEREDKILEVDRKHPLLIRVYYNILGTLYYWFQQGRERLRITSFNFIRKLSSLNIVKEIIWHTRDLTLFLIVCIFSGIAFYVLQGVELSLSANALISILIAYSGGLAALLGIIFALYSVGFQTTTEKYSSEVVDYLNSEQVGRFLFKLLTFSTLFSLSNLVVQYAVGAPVYSLFMFTSLLVAISILGILIFKDDYVTKLKPKQVFQRLQKENMEAVRTANLYDNPLVKSLQLDSRNNIQSFKIYLNSINSWSIVQTSFLHTQKRLKIYETLYRDLVREGKYEDASYGIIGLGYFLAEYISVKHFIETEFAWWFPKYQELVKADNPSIIPMKLNYESHGIGRLGVSKNNYSWLEDRILAFFKKIQEDSEQISNSAIANALITAYETILYGSYSKTRKGYEKFLLGVFENQDFDLTEKTLQQFVELGYLVNETEECRGNYVNAFGQIKTVVTDGFSKRHFPGKLNDWRPEFKKRIASLIENKTLVLSRGDITSWKEPRYFNALITDVFDRLEVEQQVEGEVVTPQKWLVKKTLELAKTEEQNQIDKARNFLVESSIKLIKDDSTGFYKDYFAGVLLSTLSQLIDQNRWDELTKIIDEKGSVILDALNHVESDIFIDTELREPIEIGVFRSLVKRNKTAYWFYLRLFFLAQIHLATSVDKQNNGEVLMVLRRPLMLGALSYLVSELDQDMSYVQWFTLLAERIYPNVSLAEFYDKAVSFRKNSSLYYMNLIYEEANRYRHYYRYVINSISDLPVDYVTSGSVPWGISSTKTVKHPSEFIRKMASFTFSDMEECSDGYVEWLKEREKLKKKQYLLKLINLLKSKVNHAKKP